MILLLCSNKFSRQIGKLEELLYKLSANKDYEIHHFDLDTNISYDLWRKQVKKADVILFQIQPTRKDLKDPYYAYLPHIYSFLHFHPSVKAKTFIIQPFYYPNSKELKQIFADKARLGDFKLIPFDSLCSLPATSEEVLKLHDAIISFINKFIKKQNS